MSHDDDQLRRLYERARIYALRHAEADRALVSRAYVAGALSMRRETPLPERLVLEKVSQDESSVTMKIFLAGVQL